MQNQMKNKRTSPPLKPQHWNCTFFEENWQKYPCGHDDGSAAVQTCGLPLPSR